MTIPRIFAKGNVLWRISPQSSAKIWWSNSGRLLLFWKYIYKKYSYLSQNDDFWWHHFLRKKNDVNPWISKRFGDFSFPRIGKISGIRANYTSLFKGLFSKARNVPLRGIYFILLQSVALFYITGFSVRFPNFVSLKIEPYGKKKIQRVVLHQA